MTSTKELAERQLLLNLGNRWAILGDPHSPPRVATFSPTDGRPLSRVSDESEVAERRIIETLKVSTADVEKTPSANESDLVLKFPDGKRVFVEIKVREHEPRRKDLEAIFHQLRSAHHAEGATHELWVINIENLRLHIYYTDSTEIKHAQFTPLNIWEYGEKGEAFERKRVADKVDQWVARIADLYQQVAEWVSPIGGVRSSQDRKIEMSEELMRKYAVPARELPILDVFRGDEPVVSFVPRGLWIIGASGRIDIIVPSGTQILVNVGEEAVDWQLVSSKDRRKMQPFTRQTFSQLLGDA